MRHLLATLSLGVALLASGADSRSPKPQRQTRPPASATMTGCVDQRGETYVLTAEGAMDKSATLRGRAFSDDNFARYVGHKVKVTGDSKDGVFHVDRIDKVAETCH
jgi:hypothetical protein